MNRKRIVLFMAAILLIGVLAACGQSAASPAADAASPAAAPGSSSSPADAAAPKEPVTVKMFYPMYAAQTTEDFDVEGDHILAEKTGVVIEWELAPPTNATERFNIMMASGSIPDIVIGSPVATAANSLKKYIEAFQPLNDAILNGNFPNLKAAIFDDEYVSRYLAMDNGEISIIPTLTPRVVGDIFLMRGDIIEKHNLTVPETTDEWFDFFVQVKELEPDMTIYASRHNRTGNAATPNITRMAEAWGVREVEFYEDGVIKYGIADPRYKEFVEFAHRMYAEGLLDQEYITSDTAIWQEKILTNGVFATHDNIERIKWADEQFAVANKPDQFYIGVLPPKGPSGERMTTIQYPHVRTTCAAVSVQSPYLEEILGMYEYVFSEEGHMLVNYGIEGVSYDMVDGVPIPNKQHELDVAAKTVPSVGVTRDAPMIMVDELTMAGLPDTMINAKELYEGSNVIAPDYLTPLVFTEEELEILTPLKADLDTYRNEWIDKFITGIEPMEGYDAFVESVKSMGLDQYLEIYNAALQRYLGQ